MKFWIGNTDHKWFRFLAERQQQDVNFWQPGGNSNFKVLPQYGLFLFRLKSPINMIGGGGFFSSHTFLPVSMAWEVFGEGNGFDKREDFLGKIRGYRQKRQGVVEPDPRIGCIVLTNPVFFKEEDWIEQPEDWKGPIVQGKSYESTSWIGAGIWNRVMETMDRYLPELAQEVAKDSLVQDKESSLLTIDPAAKYGNSVLQKVRLGQGGFRVEVMNSYERRCAITGERTLPVLDAAHIKDYAESGPHHIQNGIFLRSDLHKLYDSGYLTLTQDHKVEVSGKIREDFQNGKEYYQYQGRKLLVLPGQNQKPAPQFIEWHQNNKFRG